MKKLKKLISLLFVGIIGGFLGSLGGTDGVSKGVRRFGIPAIVTLFALFTLQNFWCISIMLMSFALSVGYGIPDPLHLALDLENYYGDKGSTLGRFWLKIAFKVTQDWTKQALYANILTRGTIGLLIALSMLYVPILTNNWLLYGVFTAIIVITWSFISWRDLGTFKVFKKDLLWSEFIIYSILVGLAQLLISI